MKTKSMPQILTKAIEDRTVTGIFAVHGNIDDGGDRSHPGAFADYQIGGRSRVVHLWNHGGGWLDRGQSPPIATIKSIRELTADELPEAIKGFAPDATGGAEVSREYLDTPSGNEILTGIKAGAITEMSYAYDVAEWKDTKTDAGEYIREIYKMKLYDTSDVNWGMNPATLAGKSGLLAGLAFADHSQAVLAAVDEWIERAEEIKRLRETDGKRLSDRHFDRLKQLGASLGDAQQRLAVIIEPLQQEAKAPDLARESAKLRSESNALRLRLMNLNVGA